MSLHTKKEIDYEIPLENEANEKFSQLIVRYDLDMEFRIPNERDRRVKAYKESFDCGDLKDPVINGRAINKMNGKEVRARIKHLYTLEKDTIISDERWTRDKSEQALLDIIGDFETKHGDRLKAIDTLNKMRGIGTPEVEQVETDDSVAIFFKKFKSET